MKTMKKAMFTIVLVAAALTAAAQDHQYRTDTAADLVDRYLRMQNADAMPADSMLQLVTTAYTVGGTDTFTIRRWYAVPLMHRIEVWHGRSLQAAYCSNGHNRFRMYKPDLGYWVDITADMFYDRLTGYDFRGPLYGWRAQNAQLGYEGRVSVRDHGELQSVYVRAPFRFGRRYMFDDNGLLALIVETGEMDTTEYRPYEAARIEMKFMHEYQIVGPMMLPKEESFVRRGHVNVQKTEAAIVGRDELLFNIDNRTKNN